MVNALQEVLWLGISDSLSPWYSMTSAMSVPTHESNTDQVFIAVVDSTSFFGTKATRLTPLPRIPTSLLVRVPKLAAFQVSARVRAVPTAPSSVSGQLIRSSVADNSIDDGCLDTHLH